MTLERSANDTNLTSPVQIPITESFSPKKENVIKQPFPGQTRIHCRGNIITSGKNAWLVYTLGGIAAIVIFLLVFVGSDMIEQFSIWSIVIVLVWLALALSMALATSWSDPGILPRKLNPIESLRHWGATDYGVPDTISRLVFHEDNPAYLFGKEVIVRNRTVFLKYCGTCQIFRPPRSSHCSFCDNCVEEFDHHCQWLSNCIGKRNYRFFIVFVVIISSLVDFLAIAMIILLHNLISKEYHSVGTGIIKHWPVSVLCLLLPILGLTLSLLAGYHCYLVSRGLTTNQQIKIKRSEGTSQEDYVSDPSTCQSILCGPQQPRMVNWSQYIDIVRANKNV